MNNTALRAGLLSASGTCSATIGAKRRSQSADNTHMVFTDEEHEQFYYKKLEQARSRDCYHKALIYVLGISEDTRKHFNQICDIKTGDIKTECLYQGWQTSGSVNVIRLAYNLYTDTTPSIDDYERRDKKIGFNTNKAGKTAEDTLKSAF